MGSLLPNKLGPFLGALSAFSTSLCVTRDQPGCLHHFVQQKLLHRWSRWSTDGTWTLFHRRFRTRAQHIWYATRSIFALICLSLYIEGTICHPAMLWLQRDVWRTWLVRSFKQPGWPGARGALSHLTIEIKSAEGDRRVQLYLKNKIWWQYLNNRNDRERGIEG